ncbi:sporulation integral membrane protein YtvI [Anaeromicropila herbilytica]|uniref:Sporulation integral membrane protein YtvI n=1 Tax=Anaeromicropila herbilytica TaxID=2785025 RepID=A0A7R7EJW4_9FIRM|nr:sporulation integral membrane protein YtvI [Anaeromicropila herbilytica]BCN29807.1 sporulation integral membrane protein YtvI [Anaeromicropila herbilytica]
MREPKIYLKLVINILIALVAIILLIYVVPKILGFFMPFVIGWIIAWIANPLVRFLEKRVKILRKHSSAIIIILVLSAVIAIIYFIGNFLVGQIIGLLSDIPSLYDSTEIQLRKASESLHGVYKVLPSNAKHVIDSFSENINVYAMNFIKKINVPSINDAGLLAKNVAETLLMAMITIISSYFFIADRDDIITFIKKIVPESAMERYNSIVKVLKKAVGGYFKAQFKIMIILMVIMFFGFLLLNIDYALLIALGIAFIDFLPVFGAGAVILPWALVDFLNGMYMRAIFLVVIYLICQVVRQVLQPKLVGDSIGISPLTTLLFMFIGYKLKGVLGMIFGIPIGMVIINLYKEGFFDGIINEIRIIVEDINKFRKIK